MDPRIRTHPDPYQKEMDPQHCFNDLKEKKLIIIFFVELHQDVVLEYHLVAGEKCLINKT